MSTQYPGGFINKTPPTVNTSSASGMWTLSEQAGYQKQSLWPAPVPFTAGAQTVAANYQLQRSAVSPLTSTTFIMGYVAYDAGGNSGIYAVVGSISGSTITFGTPSLIRSGLSPQAVDVVGLSSTSAIVLYPDASSTWAGNALTLSGTSITGVGSPTTTAYIAYGAVGAKLSSTKAIVACNSSSSGQLATTATVSGTSLTFDSIYTAASGAANYTQIASASSTTALMLFCPISGAFANTPCALAMTISGSSLSFGSVTQLTTSQNSTGAQASVAAMSTTLGAGIWVDNATGATLASGMSISGTTITPGTPVTVNSNTIISGNPDSGRSIWAKDSSSCIVVGRDTSNNVIGYLLTFSGTSATVSSQVTINSGSSRAPSCAVLTSSLGVVEYGNSTTNIAARTLTL